MISSNLGQALEDHRSVEDDGAAFPVEDSAPPVATPTHLEYVLDPFRHVTHRWATFFFLVLSCIFSFFTDSNSVPPSELVYPAFFLSFVVGTRSKFAAVFGLVPLALCRAVSATDYFRLDIPAKSAYALCLVIIFFIWGLILGAAMVQKRAWLETGNNCHSLFSHPSLSPLVFPVLVTALYQLLFRFSPIGAAGNPAMGLAYVPALRQSVSLLGEAFLVFLVGWFASIFAGQFVGRTSRGHLWFFAVICIALYFYGWVREGLGLGFLLQDIEDWPLARAGASPLRVACITRAKNTEAMVAQTNARLEAGDDLIIWSEFSLMERPSPDKFDWVIGNNSGAVIAITYGEKTTENKSYNSVELLQAGQSLGRYDKNRPVPVVESEIRAGSVLPTPVNATFTPISTNSSHSVRTNLSLKVATAICFDFDFPHLLRHARDADLAIGPSWYWASLGRNLWGDNIFRAIEDGFTLIKCAEDGISGAVDPYGRTLAALPTMRDSVHLMEVPVQPGVRTVYAYGGFVFGWLCVSLCPFIVYFVHYGHATQERTVGESAEIDRGDYQYLPDTLGQEGLDENGDASDTDKEANE